MKFPAIPHMRRIVLLTAGMAFLVAAMPAQARVFVGIGFPIAPFYAPPPVYYPPPPVYYAPPPVYYTPPPVYVPPQTYTPPPAATNAGGQMCFAGAYTCPMDRPIASGAACYCLGNSGQKVMGRAN